MLISARTVRAVALVALTCLLPLASWAQPADPDRLSRDWNRAAFDNIEVIGPVSATRLREVAEQVRLFRAAFASIYPKAQTGFAAPTRIVVFPDQAKLAPFAPRDARGRRMRVGGYFSLRPDANIMTFSDGSPELLQHEFAHYLVNRNLPQLPLWLNEGLAEFFSTFEVDTKKQRVIIGRASGTSLAYLRAAAGGRLSDLQTPPMYISLERVLTLSSAELARLWEGDRISMYYAQSWCLVHYLMVGRPGTSADHFSRFLAAAIRGDDPAQAIAEVYGVSVRELDRELQTYTRRAAFPALTYPFEAAATRSLDVSRTREADVRFTKAWLLASVGASDEAAPEIGAALAIDPTHLEARVLRARELEDVSARIEALQAIVADTPTHFGALYALGNALSEDGRDAEALESFTKAVQRNRQSHYAWLGLSLSALTLGRTAQATASMTQAYAAYREPALFLWRAHAAFARGLDAAVVSDVQRHLELAGWNGESQIYAAVLAALSHQRLGQTAEASDLLQRARDVAGSYPWTIAIIDFLDGRLTGDQLLARASGRGERTEAETYVGLKAAIEGREDEAVRRFEWVVQDGERNGEYGMARAELARRRRAAAAAAAGAKPTP